MQPKPPPLTILAHPYETLWQAPESRHDFRKSLPRAGSALVWAMGDGVRQSDFELVRSRPGGVALVLILPPAARLRPTATILRVIETCRPSAILPHHETLRVDELSHMLRRPPTKLSTEVIDYLDWRGVRISQQARQIVQRTFELSSELRSIQALARGLYMSRRALGRRFETEGLPVPSHWLHFARLLRVTLRLQNSSDSVVTAGFKVGYPDGFSLSNQMLRLTGYRPTDARKYLGWEWLLEAWLRREVEAGGLKVGNAAIRGVQTPGAPPSLVAKPRQGRARSGQEGAK